MSHGQTEIEDKVLFQAIQNGQEGAFDKIFIKYYPRLCAYAKLFVSTDDSEETVQDVMIWFWENRQMVVVDTSLKSYLFKSVKNRCLNLIRKNELRSNIMLAIHQDLANEYDNPNFYALEELSQKVEKALESLPETYRQAFTLNRFQQMSYKDIAKQLNVSSKTIDYRIQKALKSLRIQLKEFLPLFVMLLTY